MPAKLTRQHFQFFADCIKSSINDVHPSLFDADDKLVITKLALITADAMARTNPRFDRQRFLTACGV